jgi:outer membrane protein TolC
MLGWSLEKKGKPHKMYTKKAHIIPLLGALCTSCLTPPVAEKRPTYSLEKTWKHEISEPTSPAECAFTKDTWWQIYQDPTLNELIEKGLESSPTMERAFARFDEASWFTQQVGAEQFPQLSLNGYGDRRRLPKSLRTATQVPTGKFTTPTLPNATPTSPHPIL